MDLRTLLRDGVSDAELKAQIEMTITQNRSAIILGKSMSRSGQNTEECRKLEASTETQSLQVVGKAGFLNGKSKGCVHQ